MFILQKPSNKASARTQIDIRGVREGVLILPRNRYRVVLFVSPINFELKSEDEQDAIIDTYESFLNSIGFPLEILVRTRDDYLAELHERTVSEQASIYRTQLEDYSSFVRGLITTNKILTRHFYIIVPHDIADKVDFTAIREQLRNRVDIVRKGLARLGMQSRELESLELLDLFYSFYSPAQAKAQPLTQQALELLHTGYIRKGLGDE
jgi:hypothetical protein